AHQFMFANATEERPALYFTVLGEPTLKMLRYQRQFTFSFRTLIPKSDRDGSMSTQEFVQRLSMKLTSWQATTFLLGEYPEAQIRENPVFTMADGLVVMTQRVDRNSMVRQAQVLKMRGNAPQPGLHTIRISHDGVSAFPRMLKPVEEAQTTITRELISTGIPGLDEMLGG